MPITYYGDFAVLSVNVEFIKVFKFFLFLLTTPRKKQTSNTTFENINKNKEVVRFLTETGQLERKYVWKN